MIELALFPVAKGAESFEANVINPKKKTDARDSLTPGKYAKGIAIVLYIFHTMYCGKTNDNSQINLFDVIRIVFNQRFDD